MPGTESHPDMSEEESLQSESDANESTEMLCITGRADSGASFSNCSLLRDRSVNGGLVHPFVTKS